MMILPPNSRTLLRTLLPMTAIGLLTIVPSVDSSCPGKVCFGQIPAPYDQFPDANPPYYRVRFEPSVSPGKLTYGANFTAWIPQVSGPLRGVIVHQHGCGEGSCKSGLTGAYDLHWQALAKKHSCALISPAYEQPEKADCQLWCDPRKGSAEAFTNALNEFARITNHPEIASVPWALWGHSGGGHWCGGMALMYPDRVAAAWLRSGVPRVEPLGAQGNIASHPFPQAALRVPIMCNVGTGMKLPSWPRRLGSISVYSTVSIWCSSPEVLWNDEPLASLSDCPSTKAPMTAPPLNQRERRPWRRQKAHRGGPCWSHRRHRPRSTRTPCTRAASTSNAETRRAAARRRAPPRPSGQDGRAG